jgi:hypothetical protein
MSFLDSAKIAVCDNHRINQHKVFKDITKRGRTSTGWFFGFELHSLVNDEGELLNLTPTTGEVDDRRPVPDLIGKLFGKVFADLVQEKGVTLFTKLKKGMRLKLVLLLD